MKKCWITDRKLKYSKLCTLSFESDSVEIQDKLIVTDNTFPAINPNRHVVTLGLLDYNDLVEIRNVIDKQLDEWDNK